MELLKGREEIIAKVEGREFHGLKDIREVVAKLNNREVKGTPFIRDEEQGRVFGLYNETLGEVEIYSHKFNNLTNANITLVALK